MLALIQRVLRAKVEVSGNVIGEIQHGILALVGIEKTDTENQADRLLERILNYRIFDDSAGKMNISVKNINGGLLLVPQFTLVADTHSGTRPSFSTSMPPEESHKLFSYLCDKAILTHQPVAVGQFGANMQVSLCNDGPVTFFLKA